jgi:hypothetical protein
MTNPVHIPPKALEAAARALCKEDGRIPDAFAGPDGMRGFLAWEQYKPKARAACLAMLRSWPGMFDATFDGNGARGIILPLTESNDDKA